MSVKHKCINVTNKNKTLLKVEWLSIVKFEDTLLEGRTV